MTVGLHQAESVAEWSATEWALESLRRHPSPPSKGISKSSDALVAELVHAAAMAALGPQRVAPWSSLPYGYAIDRVIDSAAALDLAKSSALTAAWDASFAAAWDAALDAVLATSRNAALDSALYATRDAFGVRTLGAAVDAVMGLVVADIATPWGVVTPDDVETLLRPWLSVMGDPRDGGKALWTFTK